MNLFLDSVLRSDVCGIERGADYILQYFEQIDGDSKWKYLIDKCNEENLNINNTYNFSRIDDLIIPYDKNSIYLENWDIRTISDDMNAFLWKFKEMSKINGFTKCWNSIIMFHLMFGKRMLESEITRHFYCYLSLFMKEPFFEQGSGAIVLGDECVDASVSLRVKLYIRAIWEEMTGKIEGNMCFEIYYFLFLNPQKNTSELKTMKGPFMSCALCKSTEGVACGWISKDLTAFFAKKMPKFNRDITTYTRVIDDIAKQRIALRKNGLILLEKRLTKLIDAEVNYSNVSDVSTLWFIEALSGILRSDYANTALKSVKKSRENKFFRDGNLLGEQLFKEWYQFLTHYVDKLPETGEQFILDQISNLTTRSNGLNDMVGEGDERIENPNVYNFKIDAGIGSEHILNWKLSDKAMTFRKLLENPKLLFDYRLIRDSLTRYDPGRLFARYVAARLVRMVYGVHLWRFMSESFVKDLHQYIADMRYSSDFGGQQFPISTLGIDTGRYFTEFAEYLYVTGNVGDWTRILLSDFSDFDQTQVFENFRIYQIEALKSTIRDKAIELEKKRYEVLENRTPLDNLLLNWTTMNDAKFKVYLSNVKDENGEIPFEIIETGWVLSGEFATLATNTITNLTFMKSVIKRMGLIEVDLSGGKSKLSDYMAFLNFKLQGDDSIAVLPPKKIGLSIEDLEIIEHAFLDNLLFVAESAGMVISIDRKSVV